MELAIAILAGVALLMLGVVMTLVGMVKEQQRWVQRNYTAVKPIEPVEWDYVRGQDDDFNS